MGSIVDQSQGQPMTLERIVNRFKSNCARFARAERGNVAMMFAIALPMLLTAVGAAIDYVALGERALRHAGCDRRHRADDLEGSSQHDAFGHSKEGGRLLQGIIQPPGGRRCDVRGRLYRQFGQRRQRHPHGNRHDADRLHENGGHYLDAAQCLHHDQVGQHALSGGARARQHRLDGELRQDRSAQDRDQEADRRLLCHGRHEGRCLHLDRPVREGRQRRHLQRQCELATLGQAARGSRDHRHRMGSRASSHEQLD